MLRIMYNSICIYPTAYTYPKLLNHFKLPNPVTSFQCNGKPRDYMENRFHFFFYNETILSLFSSMFDVTHAPHKNVDMKG